MVHLKLLELAPPDGQRRISWLLELCSCHAFAHHARHLTDHRLEVACSKKRSPITCAYYHPFGRATAFPLSTASRPIPEDMKGLFGNGAPSEKRQGYGSGLPFGEPGHGADCSRATMEQIVAAAAATITASVPRTTISL